MAKPKCEFAFDLLDERYNPDDRDDRLYRLSELPAGSVARVLDTVHSLGSPANVVWAPIWIFGSKEERLRAEQEIDRILAQKTDTGLLIHSRDMITFLGCWQDDQARGQVDDWFLKLGIP